MTLLAMAALLACSTAYARGDDSDDEMEDESEDGATDRLGRVGLKIEGLLDFFLVKPEKRDPLEAVVVDGVSAEIWYMHPMVGEGVKKARCEAYQWLFFGRLNRSRGLKSVFESVDFLEEVKLVYFDVKTRIEPDGRRGYRQFRKTSPRLEVTVTRETAMNLNYEVLRARMQGPRCIQEAERVVDRKWYRDS